MDESNQAIPSMNVPEIDLENVTSKKLENDLLRKSSKQSKNDIINPEI